MTDEDVAIIVCGAITVVVVIGLAIMEWKLSPAAVQIKLLKRQDKDEH